MPPAKRRDDDNDDANSPEPTTAAMAAREGKSDDPNADVNEGWTAQSEAPYVVPEDQPGQVVTEDELPDKDLMKESGVITDPDAYLAGVHVEDEKASKSTAKKSSDDDKVSAKATGRSS